MPRPCLPASSWRLSCVLFTACFVPLEGVEGVAQASASVRVTLTVTRDMISGTQPLPVLGRVFAPCFQSSMDRVHVHSSTPVPSTGPSIAPLQPNRCLSLHHYASWRAWLTGGTQRPFALFIGHPYDPYVLP